MIQFIILIYIIWLISECNEEIRFWQEKIIRQPYNYYLLTGLLIVGFIFRVCLGFKEAENLLYDYVEVNELNKILFPISIILVLEKTS